MGKKQTVNVPIENVEVEAWLTHQSFLRQRGKHGKLVDMNAVSFRALTETVPEKQE